MCEVDSFIEYCRTENIKFYIQKVIDYCNDHKNCAECGFYNGTCRLNNIPSNWDITELSPSGDCYTTK